MSSKWNWKEKREKKAFLILEDGSVFRGYSVGYKSDAVAETVFNTGMSGYQEILSDPSYSGQFICMTYPEIGNYGTNIEDMESRGVFCSGFIMHNLNETNNWRSDKSLSEFLIDNKLPAIAGIDTRALTLKLRENGAQKSFLCCSETFTEEDALKKAKEWTGLEGEDYVSEVTCSEQFEWDPDDSLTTSWGENTELNKADLNIVAYDFGIKWNILRGLRRNGMKVTVVPATTPASEVLALKPDGVFLSNGPADPAAVTYAIKNTEELIGKIPLMGICLGHQILGLASGAKTYKLKFGHHGCNHPVKNLLTNKVEITSQNHNFAINVDSVDTSKVEITHINLNDNTVEGLRLKNAPAFSVQYHPEAAPGPHDPYYLFNDFRTLITHS